MEWRDEAIILGVRPHGETSVIVELMTRQHGRHMGRIQGGRSKRWQPVLQMGNRVDAHWWARLDEHLGTFRLDIHDFVAPHLVNNPLQLYAVHTLSSHLRLLGERDPHPELYAGFHLMLDLILGQGLGQGQDCLAFAEIFARFEMQLLSSLGFGIDVRACAATGKCEDLVYVSPRSGRAVSRHAGQPWHDRLLALPQFLLHVGLRPADAKALLDAFDLTGFFLARYIWEPRGLPPPMMRPRYQQYLSRICHEVSTS